MNLNNGDWVGVYCKKWRKYFTFRCNRLLDNNKFFSIILNKCMNKCFTWLENLRISKDARNGVGQLIEKEIVKVSAV